MQDRQRESRRRATASLGQTQNIPAGEDFRNAARGCIALHITPEIFESVKSVWMESGWPMPLLHCDDWCMKKQQRLIKTSLKLIGPFPAVGFSRRCGWIDFDVVLDLVLGVSMDAIVELVGPDCIVSGQITPIWPLDVNLKFLELVRRELKLVREILDKMPVFYNLNAVEKREVLNILQIVRCILYHRKPADGMLMDRSSCSSVGHGPASSKVRSITLCRQQVLLRIDTPVGDDIRPGDGMNDPPLAKKGVGTPNKLDDEGLLRIDTPLGNDPPLAKKGRKLLMLTVLMKVRSLYPNSFDLLGVDKALWILDEPPLSSNSKNAMSQLSKSVDNKARDAPGGVPRSKLSLPWNGLWSEAHHWSNILWSADSQEMVNAINAVEEPSQWDTRYLALGCRRLQLNWNARTSNLLADRSSLRFAAVNPCEAQCNYLFIRPFTKAASQQLGLGEFTSAKTSKATQGSQSPRAACPSCSEPDPTTTEQHKCRPHHPNALNCSAIKDTNWRGVTPNVFSANRCRIGSAKAALVLLPVWARPRTSRPPKIPGMQCGDALHCILLQKYLSR
ncbi:hypothetical protein FNV43_RR20153 [Rhamnella rubrinervis]|uniref:Uncharacterized protein n=1 Tax=Rhamnella rubrinervis TaxID=2594499 RepID=A0A8K0E0Y5_9ROSA|nr:hypothetical protein FNV43_RR20153 [Rhamnella rubrinervis]